MSEPTDIAIAIADDVALAEAVTLYESVGWTAYTASPERLAGAIAGSSLVVTARRDRRLVGLARAVSDGVSICYLQDVLVAPECRRDGIGRALVTAVLAHYSNVRQKVLLTDDEPGQAAFYGSLGYQVVGGDEFSTLRAFVRIDS